LTAYLAPRPEDVYDAETVACFRAAGYWRDETLSASVDRLAGQDRVVLTDGYGALTGTELREQAYRLAVALRRLGVGAGDRVQVQLPNWNEFVVVYVALARIGAVLVPTMPIYRHDEVRYVLRHSGAKVAVVAGEFRGFDYPDMLGEIRPSAPELQHVISVRCGERPGVLRFEDLIAGTGVPDPSLLGEPPSADGPHCVIYTSGTESRPKGCLHTLNTITFTVHALGGEVMAMGRGDVMFMPSPITHATGLAMGVIAPLVLGAGVHLMDVWDAEAGLRRIAEHQVHDEHDGDALRPDDAGPAARRSRVGCPAGHDAVLGLRRSAHPGGHAPRLVAAGARLRAAAGLRPVGGPAGDRVHGR